MVEICQLIRDLEDGVYGQPGDNIALEIITLQDIEDQVEAEELLPEPLLEQAQALGLDRKACLEDILERLDGKVDSMLDLRIGMAVERFVLYLRKLKEDQQALKRKKRQPA